MAAVTAAGHLAVPGRFRAAAVAVLAAVLGALAGPGAARAHATVVLTVNDDGRGNLSVDVGWSDGHPLTETIAATMTAVSAAGRSVGPVPLTRLPGRPTVVYDGVLPPGTWQVSVDTAVPGIGHCEATVRVAAQGVAPTSTRCGPSPAAAEPAPGGTGAEAGGPAVAGPGEPAGRSTSGWLVAVLGPAAVLAAGWAVLARGRRRRTDRLGRRKPR